MYIVIELQKSANGSVTHILTTHETQAEAESKFHTVLAAAAVSNVPVHSAVILTDNGYALRREFYEHVQPEPEPNAE